MTKVTQVWSGGTRIYIPECLTQRLSRACSLGAAHNKVYRRHLSATKSYDLLLLRNSENQMGKKELVGGNEIKNLPGIIRGVPGGCNL